MIVKHGVKVAFSRNQITKLGGKVFIRFDEVKIVFSRNRAQSKSFSVGSFMLGRSCWIVGLILGRAFRYVNITQLTVSIMVFCITYQWKGSI